MIGVTRLLCGTATPGDALRYGRSTERLPAHLLHYSMDKKPVVVWNFIRRCNLHCMHCYADARDRDYEGELTTEEALGVVEQLEAFRVPTILFSGGEPLLRKDIFDLASSAVAKGIRCVLSTNGTLITKSIAERIKETGFAYVGVSLDGVGPVHDRFRATPGSFDAALTGIRNCRDAGIRVGLRFTVNRHNAGELPGVLDLLEQEDIPRCCVYHLAYAGRGSKIMADDLSREQARASVDHIFMRARDFHSRGLDKDILTVDNHADGVYLYLKLKGEDTARAEEVYKLLLWNGGNQSGIAIGAIDNLGNVHADQFWWHYSFGNVRERSFGDIWTDVSDPLMKGLKDRRSLLSGRCRECRYLEICNGNLRERAEAASGDVWAPDPACYLTDEEIGVDGRA